MDLETAFAAALKDARAASGLSQEQLALSAGLDRTYVSLLERGLRQPTLKSIFALCNALSIPPDTLVKNVRESCNADN